METEYDDIFGFFGHNYQPKRQRKLRLLIAP